METPYSNREIQEFMNDIKNALGRIETQTMKTNGRVTQLEWFKQYSMGAIAVFLVIGLPLVSWLTYTVIELIHK